LFVPPACAACACASLPPAASFPTQLTDVETECDGWLNYDRTAKFSAAQVAQIRGINAALIAS
jgi:hypothetical protein